MGIDRVTTYGNFTRVYNDVSKVSVDLATLQNQISSGFKSENFAGIAAQARQFLQLEDTLARNDYFLDTNTVIKTRLESTSNVISQVISSATDLKSLILQRRNATNDVGIFDTQLESAWKAIAGQLNTSESGRYLFSGGRTDVKAVNDADFPVLDVENTPDTGYYQGDNKDLSVRVSENVDMVYNVRADHPGFQKIFAGIAVAREAEAIDSDAKFATAFDLIDAGIRDIISVQAQVNSNKVSISDIEENIGTLQTYWKGVKEEIGNTDLTAAATLVAINQGVLQATFQVFARITSLRLSDFLR